MQTVDWGLNMMTTGAQTLRDAERKAKQGRIAMWTNYQPRPDAPTKLHDEFTGTVTEVTSAPALTPSYPAFAAVLIPWCIAVPTSCYPPTSITCFHFMYFVVQRKRKTSMSSPRLQTTGNRCK